MLKISRMLMAVLVLLVTAALAQLSIKATPPEATISVSGAKNFSDSASGKWLREDLVPGTYKVKVEATGYEAQEKSYTLEADDNKADKFVLLRLGVLEVSGMPEKAKVEISGPGGYSLTKGLSPTAPIQVTDAARGDYTIKVSKTGFEAESFSATVESGKTATVRVALKTPGTLEITGEPAGSKVEVSGPNNFKDEGGLPMTIEGAWRGAYKVKVSREGYGTVDEEAAVVPGETKRLVVKLEKGAVAGKAGKAGVNSIGAMMVKIPAGSFMMGSPSGEEGRDNDETQHRVTLTKGFLLGATEVTQGQWQAVMGSNPSSFKDCGAECPVENVSWTDVVEFCNKLSDKEGLTRCYSGREWNRGCTGYRLPTEAEWEYAARAGSSEARYGEVGSVAWYDQNSGSKTHPAGQKQANAWGLYDMLGNVWEWVWDWYGAYPSGDATDPVGPTSGSYRVVRGGSWFIYAQDARAADRNADAPGHRVNDLGFRLSRSLP